MTLPADVPQPDTPLDHALALAAVGLRVLPIKPGAKHPPMQSWQHAATTDPKTITNWYKGLYKNHGVGIAMGPQPDGRNLFALDVDEHGAVSGSDTLDDLQDTYGHLPNTTYSITGSGGAHWIFDGGDVVVTNGAAGQVGPGIDVRGEGGQIVVAPTIHPNGHPYAWEHGYAPWEYEITRAPDWLLELVAPQPSAIDPNESTPKAAATGLATPSNDSPADTLRATWDWYTELTKRGWQPGQRMDRNGDTHWTRPGKNPREGSSAVLHPGGPFVVFTTDASVSPMWQAGKITSNGAAVSLSPLAYIAAYDHQGDLSAATKALRAAYSTVDDLSGLVVAPTPNPTEQNKTDDEGDGLPVPIDWDALYARTNEVEWLVEDVWPSGRQLHIFAARKTGKSLVMLWLAANIAAGRDPLTGREQPRQIVAYLDYEMSEDDLLERVEEMGFTPDDLRGWLLYYLWPVLPPLDTDTGGRELMRMIERDQAVAVVLDTVSRVVEGEENSADTFRAFYMHTGVRLKRRGISLARLDHEGHEAGRSRGSSAKHDDVDVIWRLQLADGGLTLLKKNARMSWIPERVELKRLEPLGYTRVGDLWPAGTAEKAAELDAVGVPVDASKRDTITALKAAGMKQGRHEVLMKALQYRRYKLGTTLGTAQTFDGGDHYGNHDTTTQLPAGTTAGTTRNQPTRLKGPGSPPLRGDQPNPDNEEGGLF